MTEDMIQEVLPSILFARLFYTYNRLDDLLKIGYAAPNNDYYEMFWELIDLTADFVYCKWEDDYGTTKWYFSYEAMMEYYRLCRTYCSLYGVKLRDNPYLQEAERFVENAMDFTGAYGYAWYLCTKVNHRWASGIVFHIDENFDAEYDLLEALLSIGSWYKYGVERLRDAVEKGKRLAVQRHMEVMAA